MEKIKMNEIATKAQNKIISENREKAREFAENTVVPQFVAMAEQGNYYGKVHVPTDYIYDFVYERVKELVTASFKKDGRYIAASWWN